MISSIRPGGRSKLLSKGISSPIRAKLRRRSVRALSLTAHSEMFAGGAPPRGPRARRHDHPCFAAERCDFRIEEAGRRALRRLHRGGCNAPCKRPAAAKQTGPASAPGLLLAVTFCACGGGGAPE